MNLPDNSNWKPPAGIRVKGGAGQSPSGKWVALVHVWYNPSCQGEPEELVSNTEFDTKDEAMAYYRETMGPKLEQLTQDLPREFPGAITALRHLKPQ